LIRHPTHPASSRHASCLTNENDLCADNPALGRGLFSAGTILQGGIMSTLTMTSESVWMQGTEAESHPPLSSDVTADGCVVGAGIAGMTTAYLLAQEGQSVVVLDDGPIAHGQTRMTTAHLSNAIDDRFSEVEKLRGEEGARLAAESHGAAIDRIEAVVRQEQ